MKRIAASVSRSGWGVLAICVGLSPVLAGVPKPRKSATKLPAIWKQVEPKERLKALRVAQLDSMRALAERVLGHRLRSGARVQDFVLVSDEIENRLEGVLKGATQTEKPDYTKDGIVEVAYGVTLRKVLEVIRSEVVKTKDGKVKEVSEHSKETEDTLIEALGNGALPGSKGMRMIRAKRAAEMDAYSKMAARTLGLRIDAETKVKDMCLDDDQMLSSISGFLKGIRPTDIVYEDDDSCVVTMQLKIREVIETIVTVAKHYRKGWKGSKEETEEINRDIVDKVFTVTGNGAPQATVETPPANEGTATDTDEAFREEKTIIRRVISSGMVIE